MDQNQLLEKLIGGFPGQVFLVGRYKNADLQLREDGVLRVFFPDFHWMSQERAAHYTGGYRFNGNVLLPDKKPLFSTFLEVLESAGDDVEVYQLGDSYDIWREIKDENESTEEAFSRIQGDQFIGGLASRLKALNASFVRGNHDNWLVNLPSSYQESQEKKDLDVADGKIRLSHGHLYDSVEMLVPDTIKASAVRHAPKVKAKSQEIGLISRKDYRDLIAFVKMRARMGDSSLFPYPDIKPLGAILVTDPKELDEIDKDYLTYLDVSIFSKHEGTRNDFDHVLFLEFADQIYVEEMNHPKNHSIHAIGHTHRARLLADRLPSGAPHVVLDCGGWIENCKVLTRPKARPFYVPSAQFAAQFGNELRIYQLGGNY
jgi:UDP-2,3-diacylglucosamine pyrophosphatase LpxH